MDGLSVPLILLRTFIPQICLHLVAVTGSIDAYNEFLFSRLFASLFDSLTFSEHNSSRRVTFKMNIRLARVRPYDNHSKSIYTKTSRHPTGQSVTSFLTLLLGMTYI